MLRKFKPQGSRSNNRTPVASVPQASPQVQASPVSITQPDLPPPPPPQDQRQRTLERKRTAFENNNTENEKQIHDQYYSELSEKFQELEQRRIRQLEKFDLTNKEDIYKEIEHFKRSLNVESLDDELEKIRKRKEAQIKTEQEPVPLIIEPKQIKTISSLKQNHSRTTSNTFFKTPTRNDKKSPLLAKSTEKKSSTPRPLLSQNGTTRKKKIL